MHFLYNYPVKCNTYIICISLAAISNKIFAFERVTSLLSLMSFCCRSFFPKERKVNTYSLKSTLQEGLTISNQRYTLSLYQAIHTIHHQFPVLSYRYLNYANYTFFISSLADAEESTVLHFFWTCAYYYCLKTPSEHILFVFGLWYY